MATKKSIKKTPDKTSKIPSVVISEASQSLDIVSKHFKAINGIIALFAEGGKHAGDIVDVTDIANGLAAIAAQNKKLVDHANKLLDNLIADGKGNIIDYDEKWGPK